jgi:glycyl-tRNA synthetase beta chain
MGREYALAGAEDPAAATAIYEHYLPRFAGDELPASIPGTIVSLADKIDTLAGCFAIGKVPTGSEDPYGLRRAVQGIVRIVLDKNLDLMLDEIFEHALHIYNISGVDTEKVIKQLLEFFGSRLRIILADDKVPPDVAEAVLAGFNDIREAVAASRALTKDKKEAWFAGIVATQSRISRIAKGAKRDAVIESDLTDKEEKELHALYLTVNWNVGEKINAGDYRGALLELAKLTAPVEGFFNAVMVMHEDERIRANRLALLRSIEKTFLELADFARIQFQQ